VRRRDFLVLLGGATWPLVARAQQAGKLPIIGLLTAGAPSTHGAWVNTFIQRLRELGWIDGRTIAIRYRWAEGRSDRYAEIAAEFVRLNVDLILTHNTPRTLAAKRATAVIPIVFATAGDPVGTGIVASLARPGGNVTGLSGQAPDTASKRVELLREIIPDLRLLGILAAVDNPLTARDVDEVQEASRTLAIETMALHLKRAEDISAAFKRLKDREMVKLVALVGHRHRVDDLAKCWRARPYVNHPRAHRVVRSLG
jgi:putative ABC transport system substrate-binding protein